MKKSELKQLIKEVKKELNEERLRYDMKVNEGVSKGEWEKLAVLLADRFDRIKDTKSLVNDVVFMLTEAFHSMDTDYERFEDFWKVLKREL